MNACDFFVLPSLNEGNPTVMFEALSREAVHRYVKLEECRSVITSEDYGLLVEPWDAGDLADKIMMALDQKLDREKTCMYLKKIYVGKYCERGYGSIQAGIGLVRVCDVAKTILH